jgi:hypothetical protein
MHSVGVGRLIKCQTLLADDSRVSGLRRVGEQAAATLKHYAWLK